MIKPPCTPDPLRFGAYSERLHDLSHSIVLWLVQSCTSSGWGGLLSPCSGRLLRTSGAKLISRRTWLWSWHVRAFSSILWFHWKFSSMSMLFPKKKNFLKIRLQQAKKRFCHHLWLTRPSLQKDKSIAYLEPNQIRLFRCVYASLKESVRLLVSQLVNSFLFVRDFIYSHGL